MSFKIKTLFAFSLLTPFFINSVQAQTNKTPPQIQTKQNVSFVHYKKEILTIDPAVGIIVLGEENHKNQSFSIQKILDHKTVKINVDQAEKLITKLKNTNIEESPASYSEKDYESYDIPKNNEGEYATIQLEQSKPDNKKMKLKIEIQKIDTAATFKNINKKS